MTRLLTLQEAAEMLRTSPDTMRYWRHIHAGPPSAKLGRRVVYREEDVRAFVEAQFAANERATVAS